MEMYRQALLASLVPLFSSTKAEKAFGFRGNRVYLTWAGASEQTFHQPTRPLFLKPDRSEHAVQRSKADGRTAAAIENWLSFSNYDTCIEGKSGFLVMCTFKLDFSWIKMFIGL
ncbi:MAG: hypothetical protein J7577_01275 [Sphingobacteriaceae bacterium]|nr:hypothetical protein [Sphingobacteriaceae bacterium]